MARALEQIISELNAVYNPQRDVYNSQITGLAPAQDAELKGLDQTKKDEFANITDRANRRGMFYSGLPVAEEQKYTGSQFLPAVANLKNRYQQQKFNLQAALADITTKQYSQGNDIWQTELNRDAQAEAAARASRAGGGGGGFAPSFGGGGGAVRGAAGGGGQNWGSLLQQSNPYSTYNVLRDANSAFFGGKASYGQLASWAEKQIGGPIGNGSAADLALRSLYLGTNLETGGGSKGIPGSGAGFVQQRGVTTQRY